MPPSTSYKQIIQNIFRTVQYNRYQNTKILSSVQHDQYRNTKKAQYFPVRLVKLPQKAQYRPVQSVSNKTNTQYCPVRPVAKCQEYSVPSSTIDIRNKFSVPSSTTSTTSIKIQKIINIKSKRSLVPSSTISNNYKKHTQSSVPPRTTLPKYQKHPIPCSTTSIKIPKILSIHQYNQFQNIKILSTVQHDNFNI